MENTDYGNLHPSINDPLILKKLVDKCVKSSYSDDNFITNNMFRIKSYYNKSNKPDHKEFNHDEKVQQVHKRRRSSVRRGTIRRKAKDHPNEGSGVSLLKSDYDRDFGWVVPWVDCHLRSYISRTNENSVPRGFVKTTRTAIENSDSEGSIAYCKNNRRNSRSGFTTATSAGVRAAKSLGIIKDGLESYAKTLSIEDSVANTIKNTNAGWPTNKRKNDAVAYDDAIQWLKSVFKSPSFRNVIGLNASISLDKKDDVGDVKSFNYSEVTFPIFKEEFNLLDMPLSLFHRFQIKLDEALNFGTTSIRMVWCVPYRIIALEEMFFHDIMENVKIKNINSESPIYSSGLSNKSIGERMVQRIRRYSEVSGNLMYSVDYSKYDRTIPDWAFDVFFNICREVLYLNPIEERIFNLLRLYMKYTPFIHKGVIKFMKRGIPSGALITNLFDTWWNLTIWYMCDIISHSCPDKIPDFIYGKSDIYNTNVIKDYHFPSFVTLLHNLGLCGDDVLISTTLQIIELHRSICMSMGMAVKYKDPCDHNKDVYFLGRYWDKFGRPWQTERFMTSRIITRSKWFKKEDVPFDISEHLELYRILSICLPFYNGMDYLLKTFGEWQPFKTFLFKRKGFYLLSDWPNDGINWISYYRAIDYSSY